MIEINENSSTPIYQQIYDNLLKLMVLKVLSAGDKLPSVRELALQIKINPNTIQKAYKALEQDGYIVSMKGKGNFVNDYDAVIQEYRKNVEKQLACSFKALRRIGETDDVILKQCETILEGLNDRD